MYDFYEYVKCPTCKELKKVSGFDRAKDSYTFFAPVQPAKLSVAEESAATLAGRVHRQQCLTCQEYDHWVGRRGNREG